MIVGAVFAAYVGTALVHRVSEHLLECVILVFLVVIGTALIVEAFLPQDVPGFLPAWPLVRLVAAVIFGIGLVSSLLGVAGGELIIPTLVFAFGVGIKTAGTASLLISLPTVAVGVLRHRRLGSFHGSRRPYPDGLPDGVGSVVEAVVGGLFVGVVSAVVVGAFLIPVGRVCGGVEVQKHPLRSALFGSLPQVELEERLGYLVTAADVRGVLKT